MAYMKYAGEEAVGRIADYVNKKLTFVSSMPSSPETDTIVLYVGADTSAYKQGGIYRYNGTNWILINLAKTGGHTIWDAIKAALTQRTKLWFADAKVTDDSTEQATKVEVVQLIDDESELDSAPDGLYQGDYDDVPEDVLNASMVAYKDGSVEDALDELSDGVVEYYDYAVSMYTSSSVSPFTYYNSVDISAFASGKRILSAQPIVTSSAQRAIAIINNTQTTAYVYGTDSSSIVLRVTAKEA